MTENAIQTRRDEWLTAVRGGLDHDERMRQLRSLLGSDAAVERFKTVALHAVVHDDSLRDADPLSIVEAIREAAVLGLEPTGVLGEAWILPYKRVARLQVGWRGYLKLIRQSGSVAFVDAQVVYMRDEFHVQFGTHPRIDHEPLLFGERDEKGALEVDRGGYRGAYAWAQLVGAPFPLIEWLATIDVDQVKKSSPAVQSGRKTPWDGWWGEMARKTAIRRLAKRLPLSTEAQRVVAYEEESDALERQAYAEQSAISSPARQAAIAAVAARRPEWGVDPAQPLDDVDEQPVVVEPPSESLGLD